MVEKGDGESEDDRVVVMELENLICMQNLHGRQILRFMRKGILVYVVVVLVVAVVFFGECSLEQKS